MIKKKNRPWLVYRSCTYIGGRRTGGKAEWPIPSKEFIDIASACLKKYHAQNNIHLDDNFYRLAAKNILAEVFKANSYEAIMGVKENK